MELNSEQQPLDGDVTRILGEVKLGKPEAQDELVPIVYPRMRQIAEALMRRERAEHTLQPTALVNETYLRMIRNRTREWENRTHFFAGVARMMHDILVDHARHAHAQKCGSGIHPGELHDGLCGTIRDPDLVLEMDRVLNKLKKVDERLHLVVELRFFAGWTEAEIADILDVDERTVKRDWALAKVWLHGMLKGYRANLRPKGPDVPPHGA